MAHLMKRPRKRNRNAALQSYCWKSRRQSSYTMSGPP